ncbi:MAG: TolC family protein [Candidatus Acidiferrales bacterium]
MTGRLIRTVVILYLVASLAIGAPAFAQAPAPQPQQSSSQTQEAARQNAAIPYTSFLFSRDYSKGKRSFPDIFAPYTGEYVPSPNLINSSNIYSMIHDGKLEISLQDAITLALQNDLNIAVEEYVPWVDETNLLNAEGGGTPASGSVAQIGEVGGGTFDPVIDASTSITDSVESISNPLTSGTGTSGTAATHTSQFNLSYTQELHSGTNFTVVLDNTRGSSSPSEDIFNPSVTSTLAVQIEQPLLNGWGFLPHTQFIIEAKNNDKIGVLQFEETVISEITNLETQYWILVADRQAVEVAKQSLVAYQKLYDDDERLLKIGSMPPSDVVFAQSFIVEGNESLLGDQASEAVQAATVLQLITKDPSDPRLKGVELVPTTAPEETPQVPSISLEDAAKEAWANRPELQVDNLTLKNDDVIIRATRNALLPTLDVTGTYESIGLSGNAAGAFTANGTFSPDLAEPIVDSQGAQAVSSTTGLPIFIGVPNGITGPTIPGGINSAYSQIFHNTSPTYAGTLTLNLPLRNRSAQAAVAQAKLNDRQEKVIHQRNKSTVFSSVNEELTAVKIDAAQVEAAVKATQLYQQAYDYEVKKFDLGQSSTFQVVIYASQLNGAKLSELNAKASYEIALANFNMALGRTLTANNITIANNRSRSIDFDASVPLIPGTVDGRLAGADAFDSGTHK